MAVEELAFSAPAHGVEAQQDFLQQFPRVQRVFLSVIVLVGVLDHIVEVGEDGEIIGSHGLEIRVIVESPLPVQPFQHQLDGVDVAVRKVLIGPEKVLEEGDVLAQASALPEGGWRFRIVLTIGIPQLGFQGVDDVLPAHEISEAAAQVGAQVDELMLRIEAESGLAALQDIAEKELQQVALALAGVAQDEDTGGSLILGAAVQVYDDVGAVAVPAHIEAVGIVLAGVVEGEEVRHAGGGQYPFIEGAEDVAAGGVGGEEALPLAEEDTVGVQLGAGQLGGHIVPKGAETIRVPGGEFDEHGAVYQRLPVAVHGGDERGHVLEVGLGGDTLLHVVGVAALHPALIGGVVEDGVLLGRRDLAGVDPQSDAAFLAQMPQQGQFLGAGGVAPQGQGAVIRAAQDIAVRVELHGGGGDHVQEVLGRYSFRF